MNTASAETTRTPEAGSGRTRASRARSTKVGLAAVLILLATLTGLLAGKASPASASTLNGTATIASPNGLAPLASGASTDTFTVTLPANAACDGDTATNGYHVFSYLQPEGTNPLGVQFTTGFASSFYGLLTSTGKYYGKANTASTTGQIIGIPNDLEFAPLLSKGVSLNTLLYANSNTSGVWEAGIACANSSGAVTDNWNTEVTFTASGTDPNGFVWSDTPGPCTTNATVAFNSAATASFNQRAANAFTASASGCPDPTITETGTLPTGVSYSPTGTGLFTGNPTQSGSFPLTLSAAIGAGTPVTQSFTLNVPVISPYAPTIGTATGGNAQATVNWTGPSNNGGAAITSYKVTATDNTDPSGSKTQTGSANPITVTGLTNGDSYTFTVAATNSVGTGPASAASNAVVPATVPDAPVIGTATGGNTQAQVAFSPPDTNGGSAITSYTVTAADSTTPANGGETQSGSASPITVTGLTNGDSYTFTVTATNSVGTGAASASSNVVVPATVPDAPVIGTATGGNTQAQVAFSPPDTNGGSAITSYTVTAADSTTPANGGETQSGSASPITVTGLTNGDSYTFTVTATNSVGTGPASAASNAVVPATVPDAPVIGTATGGNTQAQVAFSPPDTNGGSAITSYTVTAADSTTPANGGETQSGSASPITVTGLTNGDSYTFTVTATNSVGTGPASAASNAVVPATVPDAPTAPTATAGNGSATLDWTAPSNQGDPITGYVITPYIGATAQTPIEVGNVLTYQVTGLTNGVAYTFTVAATNLEGTGPASPASNPVTPATVPDQPAAPTATAGNSSATVNWSAPNNEGSAITGYVITPYIGATAQTPVDVGNVPTYQVTGLANGTAYTFTVAATNSVGTGPASAASNSVTPATVPGAPTSLVPTAGKASVKLTWKAPSNNGGSAITGYVIKPSIGSALTVGNVTSYTFSGLKNGTPYTFTVAAINSVGTGTASVRSKSVTPDGLYIVTKSLPKATKGAKYAAVTLAEKNGVGTETWTATGLPKGLVLSSAGVLSGKVASTDTAKTYPVSITVKDSSKPTKQTATTKLSLVVAN